MAICSSIMMLKLTLLTVLTHSEQNVAQETSQAVSSMQNTTNGDSCSRPDRLLEDNGLLEGLLEQYDRTRD